MATNGKKPHLVVENVEHATRDARDRPDDYVTIGLQDKDGRAWSAKGIAGIVMSLTREGHCEGEMSGSEVELAHMLATALLIAHRSNSGVPRQAFTLYIDQLEKSKIAS